MNNWKLDTKLARRLDERMQEGYENLAAPHAMDCVKTWIKLWQDLKEVMDEQGIPSLEDLDEALDGTQTICNWAMDFDMELHNAAITDPAYRKVRIDFCEEYVSRSFDKQDPNVLEMRRCAAETYFDMGNHEEGERLFSLLIDDFPAYGWGWIGWADKYGLRAKEGSRDFEKATQLLVDALQVKNIDSRKDVLGRLADLYKERGLKAEEIRTRQLFEKEEKNSLKNLIKSSFPHQAPVISIKVGRNDPCSCGSGKKYKKCCG